METIMKQYLKSAGWFIAIVFLIHLILIGLCFLFLPQFISDNEIKNFVTEDWKNFFLMTGLVVTCANTLLSVLLSLYNNFTQANVLRDLEKMKIKGLKDLEKMKVVLSERISAHNSLMKAASAYYRALAILENGVYDIEKIEESEEMMEGSDHLIVYASDKLRGAWINYWQNARRINEKAKKLSSPEARKEYWQKEVAGLGKMCDIIEDLVCESVDD